MKLAYKIAFPDELIDTYNFLQKELNRVLSDKNMRTSILSIDNELHPGKYWPLLRELIAKIPNTNGKQINVFRHHLGTFVHLLNKFVKFTNLKKNKQLFMTLYNVLIITILSHFINTA